MKHKLRCVLAIVFAFVLASSVLADQGLQYDTAKHDPVASIGLQRNALMIKTYPHHGIHRDKAHHRRKRNGNVEYASKNQPGLGEFAWVQQTPNKDLSADEKRGWEAFDWYKRGSVVTGPDQIAAEEDGFKSSRNQPGSKPKENTKAAKRGLTSYNSKKRGWENFDFTKRGWENFDFTKRGWENFDFNKRGWENFDFTKRGWENFDFTKRGWENFDFNKRGWEAFDWFKRGTILARPGHGALPGHVVDTTADDHGGKSNVGAGIKKRGWENFDFNKRGWEGFDWFKRGSSNKEHAQFPKAAVELVDHTKTKSGADELNNEKRGWGDVDITTRGWEPVDMCGCCHMQGDPACCFYCMRSRQHTYYSRVRNEGTQWLKSTLCMCCRKANVPTCCELCHRM